MKEANNEKKRNRRRGYRLKKKLVLGVSTKKPPRMVKRTFCYRPDYMPELEVFRSLPHLSSFRWEKKVCCRIGHLRHIYKRQNLDRKGF